jgi:hypothetical protein
VLEAAAEQLFGSPGGGLEGTALLHFGPALLPKKLRAAVQVGIERNELKAADVLESLTTIRRQTAIDEEKGAPDQGSLRSMRLVLRQVGFRAWLDFASDPEEADLALLAACALGVRRGGIGRNRGRGSLSLRLLDEQDSDITINPHFKHFKQLVEV